VQVLLLPLVLAWLVFSTGASQARPPEGVAPDPAVAAWFRSLRRDKDNFPCCSASDCRQVDTVEEDSAGHYRVLVRRSQFVMDEIDMSRWSAANGTASEIWVDVPPDTITIRPDNPTGFPILCYSAYAATTYCFVPREFGG
jgi:hypothetical protein